MLDFIKNAFRNIFVVILWIDLFIFPIIGGIVGYNLGGTINIFTGQKSGIGGYTFLGILFGLIMWFFTHALIGWIVATLSNIDENIESIKYGFNIEKPSPDKNLTKNYYTEHMFQCNNCKEMINAKFSICPYCSTKIK